jgi:hypothetical protein
VNALVALRRSDNLSAAFKNRKSVRDIARPIRAARLSMILSSGERHTTKLRLECKVFHTADEAFVTGTAAEVVPICQVDGRAIGNGQCRPITMQIQQFAIHAISLTKAGS